MDRYASAMEYHKKGFNCCQSVLAACSDLTGLSERDSLAIGSGFGRGIGTGEEVCGALSGALMALSVMFPYLKENDAEGKKHSYELSRTMQQRFFKKFGALHCNDLLSRNIVVDERFTAALRLGVENACGAFIVTAVELAEEIAREQK